MVIRGARAFITDAGVLRPPFEASIEAALERFNDPVERLGRQVVLKAEEVARRALTHKVGPRG